MGFIGFGCWRGAFLRRFADVLFLHDAPAHGGQILQLAVVAVQLQLIAYGIGNRHADAHHRDYDEQHLECLHAWFHRMSALYRIRKNDAAPQDAASQGIIFRRRCAGASC